MITRLIVGVSPDVSFFSQFGLGLGLGLDNTWFPRLDAKVFKLVRKNSLIVFIL